MDNKPFRFFLPSVSLSFSSRPWKYSAYSVNSWFLLTNMVK
jgi:hypothetical protein